MLSSCDRGDWGTFSPSYGWCYLPVIGETGVHSALPMADAIFLWSGRLGYIQPFLCWCHLLVIGETGVHSALPMADAIFLWSGRLGYIQPFLCWCHLPVIGETGVHSALPMADAIFLWSGRQGYSQPFLWLKPSSCDRGDWGTFSPSYGWCYLPVIGETGVHSALPMADAIFLWSGRLGYIQPFLWLMLSSCDRGDWGTFSPSYGWCHLPVIGETGVHSALPMADAIFLWSERLGYIQPFLWLMLSSCDRGDWGTFSPSYGWCHLPVSASFISVVNTKPSAYHTVLHVTNIFPHETCDKVTPLDMKWCICHFFKVADTPFHIQGVDFVSVPLKPYRLVRWHWSLIEFAVIDYLKVPEFEFSQGQIFVIVVVLKHSSKLFKGLMECYLWYYAL